MCSGSEEGSYLRLIFFLYHSILGLRVIQKKKKNQADVLWKDGGVTLARNTGCERTLT